MLAQPFRDDELSLLKLDTVGREAQEGLRGLEQVCCQAVTLNEAVEVREAEKPPERLGVLIGCTAVALPEKLHACAGLNGLGNATWWSSRN